jgi:WD40 repeat protein
MTGNTVDGSIAASVRMTNTGGAIMSGAPRELKRPPMAWNPVSPILAVAGSDNVLYLVQTTSTASNVIPVPAVSRATEVAWSPDGSQVAAAYFVTADAETHYKVATVSPAGDVTVRATGLVGDILNDLAFSPDGKWLLYRVTRGGGMWFNVADTGAGKFTEPVPVTQTDPIGKSADYRNAMSLRPTWTNTNLMIYPAWGTSTNNTPGVWTRDLSGVIN